MRRTFSRVQVTRIQTGVVGWELLAIAGILLIVALRSVLFDDLSFYDETSYLTRGLAQQFGHWSTFSDGAVYSDFYFFLSKFIKSPINLYFAGRALSAVLLVLGVWISARITANSWLAILAATLIAMSSLPYTWPSVAAPSVACLLIALTMVFRWRTLMSFSLASCLVWLAAGARPEFVWLATVFSVSSLCWAIYWIFRPSRVTTKHAGTALVTSISITIGIPLLLFHFHGTPFVNNGRDWIAFSQHFSQRWARGGEDPWLDASSIVQRSFPGASSISDAFRVAPGNFLHHVLDNVTDVPKFLTQALIQIPLTPWSYLFIGCSVILLISTSVLVLPRCGAFSGPEIVQRAKTFLSKNFLAVLLLALTAATIAIQNLVIYPRAHYLIAAVTILLVAICAAISRMVIGKGVYQFVLMGCSAILLGSTAVLVVQAIQVTASAAPISSVAVNLGMMERPLRLLSVDWGLTTYVPGLQQVSEEPLVGESFEDFLIREKIDVVMLNDRFLKAPWSSALGFREFASNPTDFGYAQVTSGSNFWIRHES